MSTATREITLTELDAKLDRLFELLAARPQEGRSAYSVEEVAVMLGRSEFTVREWCRMGRINAYKRIQRCGDSATWAISAEEITRYREQGLLPPDISRNA